MKTYNIIYADPPWFYKIKPISVSGHLVYSASDHYPTMTQEEICALPVESITEPNCVLFLWAIGPLLPNALEVISSWGFRFKTIAFVWIKLNCDGTPFFGTGAYTKSNCELCLLATRGKVGRLIKDRDQNAEERLSCLTNYESQIITTTRDNRKKSFCFHSVKPDKAAAKIERLFGKLPRIELFARRRYPGWDVWGNQIKSDIDLTPTTKQRSNDG